MRVVGGQLATPKLKAKGDADQELVKSIYEAYLGRAASTRYTERYAADVIARCKDFAAFAGEPPWMWDKDHFDRWNLHLVNDRKLKRSTQRKYQKAIYALVAYLEDSPHWSQELRRRFGIQIRQFINRDNSIARLDDDETEGRRQQFSPDQFRSFIGAIQREIEASKGIDLRSYRAAGRDYALFTTMYTCAVRTDEELGMNTSSFGPSHSHPEFGDFGVVTVLGKAKKGGGKRSRTVHVDHPELPPILDWYVKHIRPLFLTDAHPNELAMFLSERGRRLGYSTLWDRFVHWKAAAGLIDQKLVMHSLRHSGATNTLVETDPETTRRKLGHSNLGTTTGYTHVQDKFVQRQTDNMIKMRTERLKRKQ